jgi:hypothetical protein
MLSKVDRAVPMARRSAAKAACSMLNLGGEAAFVLASPDGADDPPSERIFANGQFSILRTPALAALRFFLQPL